MCNLYRGTNRCKPITSFCPSELSFLDLSKSTEPYRYRYLLTLVRLESRITWCEQKPFVTTVNVERVLNLICFAADSWRSIILDMRERLEIGRQLESWSLSKVEFLRSGEITDSLRMGWNWPEVSERLTIWVIVGTSTDEHSLRSQVGMGSESDCCSHS